VPVVSKNPDLIKNAIADARGNLTRAALALRISKSHMMAVAQRYKLNVYARKVRKAFGQPSTGRPRPLDAAFDLL
jgi:hypothetical protein